MRKGESGGVDESNALRRRTLCGSYGYCGRTVLPTDCAPYASDKQAQVPAAPLSNPALPLQPFAAGVVQERKTYNR